jgi:hypothetical protein
MDSAEAPTAERARPFGAIVPIVALAIGFCLLVYGVIGVLMTATDNDFRYFSRDAAATLDAHPAVGMLTYTGVLLVWTAATSCLLAATHLSRIGAASFTPLVVAGLGIAYLALDDLFQFHEELFPSLGIPQEVVLSVYAVLALGYLWWYRSFLRAHEWPLLALGVVALGASAALDQLGGRAFVEDGFKLFGYSLLAAYFVRLVLRLLAAPSSRAPGIG